LVSYSCRAFERDNNNDNNNKAAAVENRALLSLGRSPQVVRPVTLMRGPRAVCPTLITQSNKSISAMPSRSVTGRARGIYNASLPPPE